MSESLFIAGLNTEAELRSLMVAALAGDGRAHQVLLSKLAVKLRSFFGRRIGRDAADVEDLIQEVLIAVYRGDPKNAELCERLVDLDEGVQEWRFRHVKMVERTIGARTGTGGSSGAEYLRNTVGANLFPDLWEIRARL